jgi:hypothetical protein
MMSCLNGPGELRYAVFQHIAQNFLAPVYACASLRP